MHAWPALTLRWLSRECTMAPAAADTLVCSATLRVCPLCMDWKRAGGRCGAPCDCATALMPSSLRPLVLASHCCSRSPAALPRPAGSLFRLPRTAQQTHAAAGRVLYRYMLPLPMQLRPPLAAETPERIVVKSMEDLQRLWARSEAKHTPKGCSDGD
jgi:hypothetical protein